MIRVKSKDDIGGPLMHLERTSNSVARNAAAWDALLHFQHRAREPRQWTRHPIFGSKVPQNLPIALVVFALLVGATPTLAFVQPNWECQEGQSHADCLKDGGLKSIFMFEEIVPADARQIEEFDVQIPRDKPFPKIFITSRGGSIRAAMKIGRILRSRNAHIEGRDLFFPDRSAMCNSACVTLVAGATDRQFHGVGVLRPYISSQDKTYKSMRTDLSDADLEEDLQYFTEMDMPAKLFEYLKSTPSIRMTEFYCEFRFNQAGDSDLKPAT